MDCLGLEPRPYRLKAEYSTIELAVLNEIIKLYNNKRIEQIFTFLLFVKSVLNDDKTYQRIFMNLNVISQLLTAFVVISLGPAVIAYLAYKKAL